MNTKRPCLQAENESLRSSHSAAQHEIANLRERVQQLGQLARDVNSRRVMELEAQLEAIGAGGVEPLRKRECLHQISEPVQPMVWAIFAENGNCRMWTPDKSHAEATAKDIGLQVTPLYAAPQPAAPAQPTLTMKPLQWSDEREPNDDVRYHHVVAESPLGRITIEWKGWKKHDSRCVYIGGEYIDSGHTLEDAKKIAERHLRNVAEALTTAAPANVGWCDGCSPDNCGGCVTPASPAQAGEQKRLPLAITSAPERIWLDLGFNPYEEDAYFSNLHDLTWSQDNATGYGIEYVRADHAVRGAAQAAPVDADTGRLNWLERHSDGFYNLDRISAIVGKGFLTGPFTLGLQTNHATLREAIDAARAAQKGSQ